MKKREVIMKYILSITLLFCVTACSILPPSSTYHPPSPPPLQQRKVDFVLVNKSANTMYLLKNNNIVRSYFVGFGRNPIGHKVREGDHRTPEGRYMLTYKNFQSSFYKSIRIDYPNEADIARAAARGVPVGGDIVIHGMPNEVGDYRGPINPVNWTQGCIAVRNYEMDEIFRLVHLDTPIEIRP